MVVSELPTGIDEGVMSVRVGTGFPVIVNIFEFDVPPPGIGLKTVTGFVPTAVRSEAGMTAVSWVAET